MCSQGSIKKNENLSPLDVEKPEQVEMTNIQRHTKVSWSADVNSTNIGIWIENSILAGCSSSTLRTPTTAFTPTISNLSRTNSPGQFWDSQIISLSISYYIWVSQYRKGEFLSHGVAPLAQWMWMFWPEHKIVINLLNLFKS